MSLLPAVTLLPDDILSPPDLRWQDRITAAAQEIPHYMGSFGPLAYDTSHVASKQSLSGASLQWRELRQQNDMMATIPCYSVFDAYHGGSGATEAAINAGLFVKWSPPFDPAEPFLLPSPEKSLQLEHDIHPCVAGILSACNNVMSPREILPVRDSNWSISFRDLRQIGRAS